MKQDAIARLAADLEQHDADTQRLGYERRLMLADRDAVEAIVRPLSIAESEAKRAERDGSGLENGDPLLSASVKESTPPHCPPRPSCRECGTDLTPHEIGRARRMPTDTKYHGKCNDCIRLMAGLL